MRVPVIFAETFPIILKPDFGSKVAFGPSPSKIPATPRLKLIQ